MRALFYTVPSERCGKRARDGVGGGAVTSKQSKTVAPPTDDEDADEEEVDEEVPGRGAKLQLPRRFLRPDPPSHRPTSLSLLPGPPLIYLIWPLALVAAG